MVRYEQATTEEGTWIKKGILWKEMLNFTVMREIEFKTTLRYFTSIRVVKMSMSDNTRYW